MPKKILQVLYSGLGGHGTVAFGLLDFFQEYQNYLFFYGIEPINTNYIKQIKNENKVKHYGSVQKQTKTGLKEWYVYYRYLKKTKPDIVLLHSPQLILPTFVFSLFHNTKIITFEHDAISIRTRTKWIVTNINTILAKNIVVLSAPYLKAVKNKLWFKFLVKKYRIIPNSIDTNKFARKRELFSSDKTQLFMASRMNHLRDHITLIEAVIKLKQQEKPVTLRIAGDGETLEGLKNKYSKYPFIIFLGNLNEQEIINELNQSDIYVHSTLAETFSTAILQAMSMGLPVVTTDIEGTRHMIENNKTGLLFEPKNIDDLFAKLNFLIKNQNKAIVLGTNARIFVEENFAYDKVKSKLLEIIEKG